jgi:thermitase
MTITFILSSTALLLAQAGPLSNGQSSRGPAVPPPFAPFTEVAGEREFSGELIVRPKQTLDARGRARALAALGKAPKRHNPKTDEFIVAVGAGPVKPGATENTTAARLMATGLFQYACPNWIVYPTVVPNDPRFSEQWHHTMMQSPLAWDLHRANGANEVIIAVTDTGIVVHEDLQNRVPGFNSADDLAEADGGDMTDINGHGTHVAGCAAAAGNNSVGVSGMGWNLRIMPIRVSTAANGGASYEDLLQGIQWAAENGAKVVSTSYSGIGYPPIETTGEYVRSLDATMMWAAGNSATNHSGWDFDHVVVVGASNQSDQRASFSGYGLGVDLFAPGVSILSSLRSGGYGFASGTSMATPVANGALALVRSANPALSAEHAEYLLFNSCDFWDGVANSEPSGWGRINLLRAVEFALAAQAPQPPVARDDRALAVAGSAVLLDVLANDFDANMDALEIQSFSATTSGGRPVTLIEGTGGGRDRLSIADIGAAASTQTLSYTLVEPVSGATATATATIDISVARAADNPIGAELTLDAKYYALDNPSVLPDFSQLLSYASNLVANLNYPSTDGNFGDSGRPDNVGAVYTGWIEIPTTGFWTLSTSSDDGSKLWIGNDLVVSNDGLHGMVTVAGTRALAAGKHALRVEFFEAGGGAGLIMSWTGPGEASASVPPSRLFHGGVMEPADLNRDGTVNSQDLAILLNAWGTTGSPADLNGDGVVSAPDLAILLSRWS